jgi:hypothetical protein
VLPAVFLICGDGAGTLGAVPFFTLTLGHFYSELHEWQSIGPTKELMASSWKSWLGSVLNCMVSSWSGYKITELVFVLGTDGAAIGIGVVFADTFGDDEHDFVDVGESVPTANDEKCFDCKVEVFFVVKMFDEAAVTSRTSGKTDDFVGAGEPILVEGFDLGIVNLKSFGLQERDDLLCTGGQIGIPGSGKRCGAGGVRCGRSGELFSGSKIGRIAASSGEEQDDDEQ